MDSTQAGQLDLLNVSMDQQDALRKKLAIDALKQRLNGKVDGDKKLREACEGFESIFIGKLWQQMRQTVPKEGYLHSKEEDMYLSMFDTELAKKMASAGGIGLGDMLYEQLKDKSAQASRTAAPSRMTDPLPLKSLPLTQRSMEPEQAQVADLEHTPEDAGALYVPLEGYETAASKPSDSPVLPSPEVLAEVDALARMIAAESSEAQIAPSVSRPRIAEKIVPASLPLLNDVSPQHEDRPRDLYWPVAGDIISSFGWRQDPLSGRKQWHSGVDIAGAEGDPVASCWEGRVIFADETKDYGKLVIVEHDGGWQSFYGHNSELNVERDDLVQAGQKIAQMGDTGQSTGPHLHFELRRNNEAVDPVRIRRRLLADMPVSQGGQGEVEYVATHPRESDPPIQRS